MCINTEQTEFNVHLTLHIMASTFSVYLDNALRNPLYTSLP